RVLEVARARGERAGCSDPDRPCSRRMEAERLHDRGDTLDDVRIAMVALGREPHPVNGLELLVEHHAFDLRPAEVDPDGGRRPRRPLATPSRSGREDERRPSCRTPRAARSTTPTRT